MFIALLALLSVFQMITSLGSSHSFTLVKRQNEIHYRCGVACVHRAPSHTCMYTHLITYPFLIASLILNGCSVYYSMCWLWCWMLSCTLARSYYFPLCLSWFFASYSFSLAHALHVCCCSYSFIYLFFWNPAAMLAEKLIWLAERPNERMVWFAKHSVDFSDWGFWPAGWDPGWPPNDVGCFVVDRMCGWVIERLPVWLTGWLVIWFTE